GGKLNIHRGKLPQRGAWLVGVKASAAVVQEIQPGPRPVASQEGRGLLDRGGNHVEAVFIDLTKFKTARDIRVSNTAPVASKVGEHPDAPAIPDPVCAS